jgi:hypothetical protein
MEEASLKSYVLTSSGSMKSYTKMEWYKNTPTHTGIVRYIFENLYVVQKMEENMKHPGT